MYYVYCRYMWLILLELLHNDDLMRKKRYIDPHYGGGGRWGVLKTRTCNCKEYPYYKGYRNWFQKQVRLITLLFLEYPGYKLILTQIALIVKIKEKYKLFSLEKWSLEQYAKISVTLSSDIILNWNIIMRIENKKLINISLSKPQRIKIIRTDI